jgi:4-hydroxybenzoate polyprenyltransferase
MLKHILTLIRWKNILIIAFTMFMMRYCIIQPLVESRGYSLKFTFVQFLFLVISAVLIASAGYIINDVLDMETDKLNRSDSVVIEKHISKRTAMSFYIVINLIALFIGVFLSYNINLPRFGLIFILIIGLLWFYSDSYKTQLIVGNLIVSVLSAMVPFIVYLFEIPPVNLFYRKAILSSGIGLSFVWWWILFYTLYALFLTFIREIIKDTEDFKGDSYSKKDTLPLAFGINITKYVTASLSILIVISLLIVYIKYINNSLSFVYLIGLIVAPMIFLIVRLFIAQTKEDFHFLSNLCKWIMVSGICYGFLVRFLIQQHSL